MHPTCNLTLNRSLPLVCISSLFSFLCGVGIGANDLSANFAMVVGSGSLNMRQAIIYCTVFELLGAAFMGGHVSGTIRKGIVDPALFVANHDMVLIGMTCASFASALWLYLSTVFGLPVSITHTVVGSILGFAIFSSGSFQYVQTRGIIKIAISWFLAPIVAGAVTAVIFYFIRKYILKVKGKSFQNALWSLPYCLAFSLLIDLLFVIIEQPPIFTVTFAKFLPIGIQYLLLFLIIVGTCFFANSVIFPRLAEEAWQQSSFVWEAEVLRTEAEPQSPTATGTKETAAEEEPLRLALFVPGESEKYNTTNEVNNNNNNKTPTTTTTTTTTLTTAAMTGMAPDHVEDIPLQQSFSLKVHETSGFFVSPLDKSDVKLLPHHRVRPTSIPRRPSLMENSKLQQQQQQEQKRKKSQEYGETDELRCIASSSSSVGATYGTIIGDTYSPLVISEHDAFVEDDWGLDHPMEAIHFGGLLIKPFNPRAEYLYTALQVVAGSMSSFVHGAVAGANATATFIILYDAFVVSELNESRLDSGWAVLPAMLGIAIGMFTLGARLMKTVGVELVTVTPVRGWCIQAGGTLVTMVLTGLGIPVSLSQAQVGAAIGCGLLDAKSGGVGWGVVGRIVGGWAVTLVISATTTGGAMAALAHLYCS